MGSGGIGKTSAGLHIFHHPDVVHRFEHHRYFVATTVLKDAQAKFVEIGEVLGATQCIQILGGISSYQGNYAESSIMLNEAREQFIKTGNQLGAAQCLRALGDNVRFEGKYAEAKNLLTQARGECLNIAYSLGVEQCESSLSKVVTESSRWR